MQCINHTTTLLVINRLYSQHFMWRCVNDVDSKLCACKQAYSLTAIHASFMRLYNAIYSEKCLFRKGLHLCFLLEGYIRLRYYSQKYMNIMSLLVFQRKFAHAYLFQIISNIPCGTPNHMQISTKIQSITPHCIQFSKLFIRQYRSISQCNNSTWNNSDQNNAVG